MLFGEKKQYIPESRMAASKLPSMINEVRVAPQKLGNVMAGNKQPVTPNKR